VNAMREDVQNTLDAIEQDHAAALKAWHDLYTAKQQYADQQGAETPVQPEPAQTSREHTAPSMAIDGNSAPPAPQPEPVQAAPAPAPDSPPTARDINDTPSHSVAHDNLTVIHGIGSKIQYRLRQTGITTLKQLAESSPDELRNALEDMAPSANLQDWIDQAKELS
jgi:predicted flap endonuclease-1-like 5' DNA nuclease